MSKVISLSDDAEYLPWQAPELNSPGSVKRAAVAKEGSSTGTRSDNANPELTPDPNQNPQTSDPVETANPEQEKKILLEAAYRKGYEEGLQEVIAANDIQKQQLMQVLQNMSRPLDRINDAVETELVELSLAVAKLILRREISEDPAHIVGLIREAIKQLPASTLEIRVHLHPGDAKVVRDVLTQGDHSEPWQIDEDAAVQPGDCQIHTDTSFIDAGIDGLINRLAAEMLGSHRATDLIGTNNHGHM